MDRALAIVEEMQAFLGPQLRQVYPNAVVKKMKRGVVIIFNAPYPDGEDPTVDFAIALNRLEDDALWIPNLDRNRWDPSHPEKHVELLNAHRARISTDGAEARGGAQRDERIAIGVRRAGRTAHAV